VKWLMRYCFQVSESNPAFSQTEVLRLIGPASNPRCDTCFRRTTDDTD